jgi:ParB-like chromosome segregation protein Spo0J
MTSKIPDNGTIELWDVAKLVPYENNAKKHSDEQIDGLIKLIQQFGWTQPIVIQKTTGSIIAGHGRRLAAIKMGLKKVPALVLDISDAETRALRLADNRAASTDYDTQMIQTEIYDLKDLGYDLLSLNFNEQELAFLQDKIGELDESAFIDDISSAVEHQKTTNADKQALVDEQDAPLAKAFGFKRFTIAQSRRVKAFMTQIEVDTGKTGALALMAYFDEIKISAK